MKHLFEKLVERDFEAERIGLTKRHMSLVLKSFYEVVGSTDAYKSMCKRIVEKHPGMFPELEAKVLGWFTAGDNFEPPA